MHSFVTSKNALASFNLAHPVCLDRQEHAQKHKNRDMKQNANLRSPSVLLVISGHSFGRLHVVER